jgi:hypothetical protein
MLNRMIERTKRRPERPSVREGMPRSGLMFGNSIKGFYIIVYRFEFGNICLVVFVTS